MPIDTIRDLRSHLELAIKIELSTVPPYLYAMHSIDDQSSEAALLIRSIVAEEMLHAALTANLLLAVGGEPRFSAESWLPLYPGPLPHHVPPLIVGLEPVGPEVIRDVFMRIEQPEIHGAPPEPDVFETLGQFYHALEQALERLDGSHDLFAEPQVDRQMSDASYYAPVEFDDEDSGGLLAVTDLATASEAIEIIVHQGEGLSAARWADPEHHELTHYHKLVQIADGTSPLGRVLPLPSNPRVADYPDAIRSVAELFNAVYRYTYLAMDRIYQGGPAQGAWVGRLYRLMVDALSPLARYLVNHPLGDGVAAPTFEVYRFGPEPEQELLDLAGRVATAHPKLEGPAVVLDSVCSDV